MIFGWCVLQMTCSKSFRGHTSRNGSRQHISAVYICFILCNLVNFVSSKCLDSENAFLAKNGQGNDDTTEKLSENDANYDWQLSTDNVDLYSIISRLDLEEIIASMENMPSDVGETSVSRRPKRSVDGVSKVSSQKLMTRKYAETMPYAATVMISSKCTGTLISPKHVLTAAHCVFKKRRKVKKLRVGIVRKKGRPKWRKVRKIYVDKSWHKITRKSSKRTKHDYAVLEIGKTFPRPHMTPIVFNKYNSDVLQFNGFPINEKDNTMWSSRCNSLKIYNGLLMTYCYMSPGMSGSGAYLKLSNDSYGVRGLVIGTVKLKRRNRSWIFRVINPITESKKRNICKWIKAERNC